MIDIRRQIEQCNADASVKEILRNLMQELGERKYRKDDVVVVAEGKGVVVRNADNGRYYRIKVSGTTPVVGITDLGTKVP